MCGIFGIFNNKEAAKITSLGLHALQHRGQESAGISTVLNGHISTYKGEGLVDDVFQKGTILDYTLLGSSAIGHVRYSTQGGTSALNIQPFSIQESPYGNIAVVHNGNITNADSLRVELVSKGIEIDSTSDTEIVLHLIKLSKQKYVVDAIYEVVQQLEGAVNLLFLTQDLLIGYRDKNGYRPLEYGVLNGSPVFASETCAFDLIGADHMRTVEPGCLIEVGAKEVNMRFQSKGSPISKCIFEQVYLARPDSIVFSKTVASVRENLGRSLALEHPAKADIVVPVPDSGIMAALGYSRQSGIPYSQALIRNHYVGRTFIQPNQEMRDLAVKLKLNPIKELINGKRIVLVDDSIIRGTTSRNIVKLLRNAGAAEIHMRVSCPPTISPCYWGIDIPNVDKLIGNRMDVEGIREYIGVDSLGYLSLEALKKAVVDDGDHCVSCYKPALIQISR